MFQLRNFTCRMSSDAMLLNVIEAYSEKLIILAVSCKFYENLCKLKQVDCQVMAETFDDSEAMDIYEDETRTRKVARLFFYELNGVYFLKEVVSDTFSFKKSYNSEGEEGADFMIFIDF